MHVFIYLAASSHLHHSSLNTPNPSLTHSLSISDHHQTILCFLETSTEPIKINTMKPSFTSHQLLLISSLSLVFVFLLSSFSTTTTTASRLLIPKTGDDDIVVNIDEGFSQMNSVLEKGLKDENLMGVEEDCGDQGVEEEECLKRRMISEAHLDYIYTQHQHP